MRISMVSEHASPLADVGGADAGGQNVHVAALSRALAARGHDVVVHTRRDSPDLPDRVETADGYAVEHIAAGPPTDVPKDELLPHMDAFGRELARRWARRPPDVAHAHFWMSGLASVQAAAVTGVPVLLTFHALGTVKKRHQGRQDTSPAGRLGIERELCDAVARVVATCADEGEELRRLGARPERVSTVPCGVDLGAFSPKGPVAARGRRPRLLVLGRLVERKGVQDVLRALPAVPDAELVVAGGPDLRDLDVDPEVERLRRVAGQVGVADRVVWTGRTSRADVPALVRSADVVVAVPWYEQFGIVPLEAMACARPVVASAVGGLAESVVDGVTGDLVPARDPQLLGAALRALLADGRRRQRYGTAGLRRARARYGWERVAQSTEQVYEQVLAEQGRVVALGGVRTQEEVLR